MRAFGRDGILSRDQIRKLVAYLRSLSGAEFDPERAAAGETIFAESCASCHGADASGMREIGAPDLTDDFWLYGADADSIFHTIHDGRQGWMPAWEDRMSLSVRKIMTLYLQQIAEEEQP